MVQEQIIVPHSAIGMTPFQAVYGRTPPTIPTYVRGTTTVQAVEQELLTRDLLLQQLKQNLAQAQHRMQLQANKKRRDAQFSVGDLALVKLQPYRQTTVASRLNSKLCRRYFGPFPVLAPAGPVAYILKLPAESKIHPTFLVSLLKAFKGDQPVTSYPLPDLSHANKPMLMLIAVLAARITQNHNKPQKHVLVQWSHSPPEDSTWEDLQSFSQIYNIPNLEDKVVFEEGSSDSRADLPVELPLDISKVHKHSAPWAEAQKGKHLTGQQDETTDEAGRLTSKLDQNTEASLKKNEGEEVETRRVRMHVRPGWVKDYVMKERRCVMLRIPKLFNHFLLCSLLFRYFPFSRIL